MWGAVWCLGVGCVGCGVWNLGVGLWGGGCIWVWGVGCGVWGVGCGVWGVGCEGRFGVLVWGMVFGVSTGNPNPSLHIKPTPHTSTPKMSF